MNWKRVTPCDQCLWVRNVNGYKLYICHADNSLFNAGILKGRKDHVYFRLMSGSFESVKRKLVGMYSEIVNELL